MPPHHAPDNDVLAMKRHRRRVLQLIVATGGILPLAGAARTLAFQDAPATPNAATPVSSPVAAVTVHMMTQLRFEPAEVTIRRGETVTWINDSPIPHTTTGDAEKNPVKDTRPELAALPSGAAGWDSGLLNQQQTFSHTFTVAGEYQYFCIPHVLSGMLGTIIVDA